MKSSFRSMDARVEPAHDDSLHGMSADTADFIDDSEP
jgi:hypothetical protein